MFNPQKIKTLINERKLVDSKFTLGELCVKIELSAPGLNNIMEGKSIPKVTTLEMIADYFGVSMNYFFEKGNEESKKISSVFEPDVVCSPPKELEGCYKIMYEQQVELGNNQKEINELNKEVERLKKLCARGRT